MASTQVPLFALADGLVTNVHTPKKDRALIRRREPPLSAHSRVFRGGQSS
jgi:hypothetical protein